MRRFLSFVLEVLKALLKSKKSGLFSKPQVPIVSFLIGKINHSGWVALLYCQEQNKNSCCWSAKMTDTLPNGCYLFFSSLQKVAKHPLVRSCQPWMLIIALFHVFIEDSLTSKFLGGTSVKNEKSQWSTRAWAKITVRRSFHKTCQFAAQINA